MTAASRSDGSVWTAASSDNIASHPTLGRRSPPGHSAQLSRSAHRCLAPKLARDDRWVSPLILLSSVKSRTFSRTDSRHLATGGLAGSVDDSEEELMRSFIRTIASATSL